MNNPVAIRYLTKGMKRGLRRVYRIPFNLLRVGMIYTGSPERRTHCVKLSESSYVTYYPYRESSGIPSYVITFISGDINLKDLVYVDGITYLGSNIEHYNYTNCCYINKYGRVFGNNDRRFRRRRKNKNTEKAQLINEKRMITIE